MNKEKFSNSPEVTVNSGKSFKRLTSWMKPYFGRLSLCGVNVVIANLAELICPLLTAVIIDDFLTKGEPQRGIYSVVGIGLIYFILQVLGSLCNMFQRRMIAKISQSILFSMRSGVYEKIMRMSVRELDSKGTGRLITRATNDVETVNEFYSDVFINLFKDIFLLIGILIFMFCVDVPLALVSVIGVPLVFAITFSIKNVVKENHKRIKTITGKINGFIAENITGMRLVQTYSAASHKFGEFGELNGEYYKSTMLQVFFNTILRPSMEVVNNLVIALLIAFSVGRVTGGALEVGVLYAFTTYVKKFFNPINDLADKYTTVQSTFVSMDRISEVLDCDSVEDSDGGTAAEGLSGEIEFRDVWFAYNDEEWVLKGVSFKLSAGQSAAFVGATGVGKSTIISLIGRYYSPQRGEILIDGVNINDWKLSELRKQCAVVLQEVFLFNGTIRDNIRMNGNLGDEGVLASLKTAGADAFLELPKDLDFLVAEQGVNFSTGERQLLSFARAIAYDPSVLVLDEATAHIDSKTEEMLQKSIAHISRSRTCIFIAHRLSTIKNCDVIFVLVDGKVIESGSHDELMQQGGEYKRLVSAAKDIK